MRTTLNAVRLTTCVTALLLAVCASETLFRRTFDSTPNGQPPATAQSVGTAQVFGVSGGVTVIAPPVTPSGKWIQIGRLDPQGDVAGMQGRMTKSGEGVYTFSATMFMPAGAGVATVQFEQSSNGPSDLGSFLHLDFMPDNTVRIDDNDATKFGSFQRNQPFTVRLGLLPALGFHAGQYCSHRRQRCHEVRLLPAQSAVYRSGHVEDRGDGIDGAHRLVRRIRFG